MFIFVSSKYFHFYLSPFFHIKKPYMIVSNTQRVSIKSYAIIVYEELFEYISWSAYMDFSKLFQDVNYTCYF
jgi:hypothetical protein